MNRTHADRPWVIAQTEVSVDGAIEGFDLHMGAYYGIAAGLGADAELMGAGTMLAAGVAARSETADLRRKPPRLMTEKRHLWFVPDSRGRVANLHQFRDTEWCLDVVPLICASTPAAHQRYLREREYDFVVAGDDRVDLAVALGVIKRRFGIGLLRVDSGGDLVSALLARGLVDELSLLVTPVLVGEGPRKMFRSLELKGAPTALELLAAEPVKGGLLHLRYAVTYG